MDGSNQKQTGHLDEWEFFLWTRNQWDGNESNNCKYYAGKMFLKMFLAAKWLHTDVDLPKESNRRAKLDGSEYYRNFYQMM